MSRKFDRKQVIIATAARALERMTNDPKWVLKTFTKSRPRWMPRFLWARMLKMTIKIPKM